MNINKKSKNNFFLFLVLIFILNCSQSDIYKNASRDVDRSKKLIEITIVTDKASTPNGLMIYPTAIGNYNDLTMENITGNVTWESDDETKVIITTDINDNIVVQGVGTGHAIITASMDGVTSKDFEIDITDALLYQIVVTTQDMQPALALPSLPAGGYSHQFKAWGYYSDIKWYDLSNLPELSWESTDPAIATIDLTGNATTVSYGTTNITAAMNDISYEYSSTPAVLTVAQLSQILISPRNITKPLGVSQRFTASGFFYNTAVTSDITDSITWSSTPEASFTSNVATGIAFGPATITAAAQNITRTTALYIDRNIYVSAGGSDTTGDGTIVNSTPAPFATIGHALDIAQAGTGMKIYVSGGYYPESIMLKDDVCLYGGFSDDFSTSDRETYQTIIDPVTTTSSIYAIAGDAAITPATEIDGFIIHGSNSTSDPTYGIFCDNGCSPVLKNNRISGGTGSPSSYGIYCNSGASPAIHDNIIYGGLSGQTTAVYIINSSASIQRNKIFGGNGTASSTGITITGITANTFLPSIQNNIINGGSASFTCGINASYPAKIQNNTIYGGTNGGTTSDRSIGINVQLSSGFTGLFIQNNIIFCNKLFLGFGIFESGSATVSFLDNNNVFDCMNALYRDSDDTLFTRTRNGNFAGSVSQLSPEGRGNISTSLIENFNGNISMFVNLKGDDGDIDIWDDTQSWALATPEPTTADGGRQLVLPPDTATDIAGNPRTKPWSIGAYENDSSGLVAFYPLNGDANDESASNINGIIEGLSYDAIGRYNTNESAFYFDGTGYILVTSSSAGLSLPLPTGSDPRTICMWIRYENVLPIVDDVPLLHYGWASLTSTGNCDLSIKKSLNKIYFYGDSIYNINFSMPSSWIQICAVYDSGTAKIYINGTATGSQEVLSPLWNTVSEILWIGRSFSTDFFTGSIDDVRIYKRALSAPEIANIFNMEKP